MISLLYSGDKSHSRQSKPEFSFLGPPTFPKFLMKLYKSGSPSNVVKFDDDNDQVALEIRH